MMSPIPEAVSSRAGGIVEPVSCYLLWDPRGHVLLVEKEHGEGDWCSLKLRRPKFRQFNCFCEGHKHSIDAEQGRPRVYRLTRSGSFKPRLLPSSMGAFGS